MTNIKITIETDSMTKVGDVIKVIIGTISASAVGTMSEMTGIEVNIAEIIEEILRIETACMTEAEAGMEMKVKELGGVE